MDSASLSSSALAPDPNLQITKSAFDLGESTIEQLSGALSNGSITSTDLVAKYLHRIAKYDWNGLCLNSIPLLNEDVFKEAAASDDRRAAGLPVRPLEGIPYTIKDNFAVSGMTAAAGSPAFGSLHPKQDSFLAEQLRHAGAVLIGKTNMPPMARGGMQRGLYGRAESPYNSEYLTAAFGSGSSNGSATSTAASFAAFGLGTETVSSGRSPASNNALIAYTPSRGVISMQGVWPLYAVCDVVTPHTRCMEDMYRILPILTAADPSTEGDFWRWQNFISLPKLDPSAFQPPQGSLSVFVNKRVGVPKMFIGKCDPSETETHIAPSVLDLWHRARADLEEMGATVVETDFPVLSKYEANYKFDLPESLDECPQGWVTFEQEDLLSLTWKGFLEWAKDANFPDLQAADPGLVFPLPKDYIPHKFDNIKHMAYEDLFQLTSHTTTEEILGRIDIKRGLSALEAQRKQHLEEWMDRLSLDMVVFPANGDVGRADIETNETSAREGLRNGVKYSHGNRVLRHLGIPSVSVSMGMMADTRMPVNLTFIGKAYEDGSLLQYAHAYEQHTRRRVPPPLTPALPTDTISLTATPSALQKARIVLEIMTCEPTKFNKSQWCLHVDGIAKIPTREHDDIQIEIFVDGQQVDQGKVVVDNNGQWDASISGLEIGERGKTLNKHLHHIVVVLARAGKYRVSGSLRLVKRSHAVDKPM